MYGCHSASPHCCHQFASESLLDGAQGHCRLALPCWSLPLLLPTHMVKLHLVLLCLVPTACSPCWHGCCRERRYEGGLLAPSTDVGRVLVRALQVALVVFFRGAVHKVPLGRH